MKQKEMFDKSRERWGLTSQFLMLAEECSELAVVALHMTRNIKNDTKEKRTLSLMKLGEEIADVQFMIDEFLYYLKHEKISEEYTFFDWVVMMRKEKERRLTNMLTVLSNKEGIE